ncbi:MAG TPA: DUF2339 domain-containing protein [Bdellovibrionota bacterium]|nr:DUF2339 domain-containing protein [Bdellovibrionota bacterium]
MPILGAVIGAFFAIKSFGLIYFPLGAVIGFLVGVTVRLHVRMKDNETTFLLELMKLQNRVADLERQMKFFAGKEAVVPDPLKKSEPIPERASETVSEQVPEQVSESPPEEIHASVSEPNLIVQYFTTGNTIAKIGAVLLFFGVAFLLKYVSDQGHFPIEMRLLATAFGAAILFALGWKLRYRKGPFGLVLQGCGVGIFYLTVFAAYRLYDLLPEPLAFAFLVSAVVLSSVLAVLQDSRVLAVFGVTGGFLAPVLASTGSGSHVMLFGYYAILNSGILAMAWFRSWRDLNLVGFAFTFVIASFWGNKYYVPEFFGSTEPFLIFFFLLYFAVALLFAGRKRNPEALAVDSALVFGVPIAAFVLQSGLVKDTPYGLAWSAVALAAFYLVAARVLFNRRGESLRLLVEAFFSIGVCFLTLAVPFALDGKWTAAVWALEGAALLWSGVRQNRVLARWGGMALQLLAGLAFFFAENRPPMLFPVLNAFYMGTFVLSLSHFLVGFFLHRADSARLKAWEKDIIPLFIVIGTGWCFGGAAVELRQAVSSGAVVIHGYVLFLGASLSLFRYLSRKLDWEMLGEVRRIMIPVLTVMMIALFLKKSHPAANIGALAWPVAFLSHYLGLRDREIRLGKQFSGIEHYAGFWLLTLLATWEAHSLGTRYLEGARVWADVTLGMVPALFAFIVIRWKETGPWPVGPNRGSYLGVAAIPLLVWAMGWMMYLNFTNPGYTGFITYLPILNPIDLTQLVLLLVLGFWGLWYRETKKALSTFAVFVGLSAFVWVTAVLTRTLHHWADLPWDFQTLFESNLVQTSLSIFWSSIALGLMILATGRKWRILWITGAALLGIVVLKLFLIDLSGRGTLERVISFIGTGLLLLVIGYFAPIPPSDSIEKKQLIAEGQ